MKGHTSQSGSGTSRKPRQTRRLLFFGALLALTAYNVHRLLQSSETPQIQRKLMTNSESKKLEDVTSIQGDSQLKAGGGVTETTRNGDNSGNAASKRQVSNQSQVHKSKAGAIVAGGDVGGAEERKCHTEAHAEYDGDVVGWGATNLQNTAAACCQSCREKVGCKSWVWCPEVGGCTTERKHKECWLKSQKGPMDVKRPKGSRGSGVTWTSGSLYTASEAVAALSLLEAAESREAARLAKLKDNKELPLVFLDVEIKGKTIGRMEFVLFTDISPRSAENFRQLCTGEAGVVPKDDGKNREGAGKPYHYKGKFFYRIIDRFIDQTGAETESVFGGQYKDDQAGLKLQHDRKGLLSMANMGPNTNTAHFSIMQAPAHHLDTHYTIFGELVSGWHVAEAINVLSRGKKDNTAGPEGEAKIVDSGQIRKGTLVPDLSKP